TTTQVQKFVEDSGTVLWPRCAFGVVLHGERGQRAMTQTFDAAVVEVTLADVPAGILRQRRAVDLELAVLRGPVHGAGVLVAHRVVATVMAELQARRRGTCSLSEYLMAEADAQHRHLPLEQLAAELDGVRYARRIARTVGEHDAVRSVR